jgi:hypothetical protein
MARHRGLPSPPLRELLDKLALRPPPPLPQRGHLLGGIYAKKGPKLVVVSGSKRPLEGA